MQSVGDQIRGIRTALQMTQEQLAQRTGLPQSMIADIENGKRANLGLPTINKLAEGLNCQFVPHFSYKKDISEICDEQSENIARKIISLTSGSTAIELQLPSQSVIDEQIKKLKSDIKKNPSTLWQKI